MRLLVSSTPRVLPSLLPGFSRWLGVLVTPRNGALANARRLWDSHGCPWAADNDCFQALDVDAYGHMVRQIAGLPGCLWLAAPDVVADAKATLASFARWHGLASEAGQPLALVGQDGMEGREVPWGEFAALFIGGSTEWKLSKAAAGLMAEARRRGKHVHMGRVNTRRRYRHAQEAGADTIDGTNVCKWPDVWLPRCVRWLRHLDGQGVLFP